MNENEKNLFYKVLKDKVTEEPTPKLAMNIMHIVHKKAHEKLVISKILEVLGCILLGAFAVGFLCFYTDFKFPALKISFGMPAKIYIVIIFIIFVFSLIDLYFRKKLYERG
ncbi:MAG: hypothetical protein FWD09_03285 [Lentimicrobiaceae bacterium]|nr:hypothetical protein [Lentimicrobiaceae bacterium]